VKEPLSGWEGQLILKDERMVLTESQN